MLKKAQEWRGIHLMQERDPVHDRKYRDSFKKMHAHTCLLTGSTWTEYSAHSITGCHITIGRYGWNIKDDSLILPIRQDLHMEMDRGQSEFLIKHFDDFPMDLIARASDKVKLLDGKMDLIGIVKQLARDYYDEWKNKTP